MERLRFVAGAGSYGLDPVSVVTETAEALRALRPAPAALVNLLRPLVARHPSCGPLWWFGAHLLTRGLDQLWELVDDLLDDPTESCLAEASLHHPDAVPVEIAATDGQRVVVSAFDADLALDTSVVLVARRGTVLPTAFVTAIDGLIDGRRWTTVRPVPESTVVAPDGIGNLADQVARACPSALELIPPRLGHAPPRA